jgi:hypothetical protein
MDKSNTFEIDNKFYVQGKFSGQYKSKVSSAHGNTTLSKINIIDGVLIDVEKVDFNALYKIGSNCLFHKAPFTIEVNLDDELLKDKYIFIEEITNSTIYDVKLTNQIIEGETTFGTIEGVLICHLEDSCEFEMYYDDAYIISKVIDFGDRNIVFSSMKKLSNYLKWGLPKSKGN